MNLREFVVLDVLNIASTKHQRDGEFQASAAEMIEVFRADGRWEAERQIMGFNERLMGASLGHLSRGWPTRREPLVERHGSRRWRLTNAGVRVLGA